MKKTIAILTFGILAVYLPAAGQAKVYDILLAGKSVGELTITPSRAADGSEHTRVRGAIDTFMYDVVYVSENRFENGVLKTSMSSQEVNGKPKEKTVTVRNADRYRVTIAHGQSAAKETAGIFHPINLTVTSLYYREPLNMKRIYSDRYGVMCPVQRVDTGIYDVVMPEGRTTRYTYAEGRCQEVKSQIAGLNLIFRIRSDDAPSAPR